ncbi:hypothetical protein HDV06_003886 [Boothiomyces sp. JEL0866]|nr:hypothetical protein HDV06_003886 [Boothiomyces sp. JEL0866]
MEFPKIPIFLLVALLAVIVGLKINGLLDFLEFEPEWMYPKDEPSTSTAHANYLKYIPVNPNDPGVPLDVNREYTYADFKKYFNVHPLHEVVFDNHLKIFLDLHNLRMDTENYKFPPQLEQLAERAKRFIDAQPQEEDRFVVKWSSKQTGFGLFAKKPVSAGDIVGVYTGVVNLYPDKNSDYIWQLTQIKLPDGQMYNLGINGRKAGNYLRFVNHIGETANVKPVRIPYKGKTYCIYVADKDIDIGEELFTDYGEGYFKNRRMILAGK